MRLLEEEVTGWHCCGLLGHPYMYNPLVDCIVQGLVFGHFVSTSFCH